MDTIYNLLKRAKELKEKSQVDSITPEEVGKLHEDTLAYIASLEQSTDGLGIKKVYQSKSAMEADTDPVGTNGKTLRYGQLVSIYDDAHADSSENGNIYAYQKPGWLLMGKISGNVGLAIAQETGDSTTSVMSQKAVSDFVYRSLHTHEKEVSFEWTDKTYYTDRGVLNFYSTAGKYCSVEVDLTKYIGKTIRCWYYTPNNDVIRSVIVNSDDSIVPYDNPNSEVKELIVTADMKLLRLSNYTHKLANPYVKVDVEVLGVTDRLDDIEKKVNGYYTEKDATLIWISDEYYNKAGVVIKYNSVGRKQRTSVDLSDLTVGTELHILSYSDSSSAFETYSFVLTKSGKYRKLVLSPTKEAVFIIDEPCDILLLSDDILQRPSHTPYVKIREFHSGIKQQGNTSEKKENKHVDLFLFMGQSNMAGRGIVTAEHREDAPRVVEGGGYEFRAISDPTRIYPITKTLGVAENVSGAINDYNKKTGGIVPSFVNSYYRVTETPVIAVSASIGGTQSASFKQGTPIFNDAVNRLTLANKWLKENGYTILHTYMVWCQGESDGDENISINTYKANFANIFEGLKSKGVEKCFMIRIGEDNGTDKDYSIIMQAQNQICKESEDVVMVSLDFQSMLSRGLMKDAWHYFQQAYNEVGATAGYHAGIYRMYNREPVMYDPKNDNLYYTRWSR